MLAKLRFIQKYRQPLIAVLSPAASATAIGIIEELAHIGRRQFGGDSSKPEIIDINFEDMMYENEENASCGGGGCADGERMLTAEPPLQSTGIDGAPIAPIDINPWIEEEEYKQGTVYEETVERKRVISELPEPPTHRTGVYEFKGIKIILPQRMLRAATYRYRIDKEDLEQLADDIRICKFEKK